MERTPAIVVNNISKSFRLPHEQYTGARNLFINIFRHKRGYEEQKVLDNISFTINKGDFFGIVGRNGSGKSTLLKLLAGIYPQDRGEISVRGSLVPFIELGVGFNPELTGRENVFLNGALLGFSRKEVEQMYPEIVEFAELEKFMDQRLKNYSSGMQVRLAFSIAIRAKSDILILDEVLAVGDAVFQAKCYEHFNQLKKQQQTVVLVSHDTSALQRYCNRGLLLEDGEIVHSGSIDEVLSAYTNLLNPAVEASPTTENSTDSSPVADEQIGTGDVQIVSAKLIGVKRTALTEKDHELKLVTKYRVNAAVDDPIFGLTIQDSSGARVFVCNNHWSHKQLPSLEAGQKLDIVWTIPNIFNSGTFTITPAVARSGGAVMLAQADEMVTFKVQKRQLSNAYTNVEYKMEILTVD